MLHSLDFRKHGSGRAQRALGQACMGIVSHGRGTAKKRFSRGDSGFLVCARPSFGTALEYIPKVGRRQHRHHVAAVCPTLETEPRAYFSCEQEIDVCRTPQDFFPEHTLQPSTMVPVAAHAWTTVSTLDSRLFLVPRNHLCRGTGLWNSVPIFFAGMQTHLLANIFGTPPGWELPFQQGARRPGLERIGFAGECDALRVRRVVI